MTSWFIILLCSSAIVAQQSWLDRIFTTFRQAIESADGGRGALARYNYKNEKVQFYSQGTRLVGILCTPEGEVPEGGFGAITFLGPYAFVKEQAPIQYATRLASMGFVTLAFDPRTHGESEGEPRRWESPSRKAEDVSASIDYLQSLPNVNRNKIGGIGICQGAPTMVEAAAKDDRLKAVATVAGNYVDRENQIARFGSEDIVRDRIKRGDAAKHKFETTGEVDYLPIIDPERKDVGLPGFPVWVWYHGWVPGSNWENRYTVMSDAEIQRWDSKLAAAKVTAPYLMVHSDRTDCPPCARKFYGLVPAQHKKLVWMGDTIHTDFYNVPQVNDKTATEFYYWFAQYLSD